MSFKASIITLYPEMFPGSLGVSLAGRALEQGAWEIETTNLRDFGLGKHKNVDETPAGGGAGMVLRADVLGPAIDSALFEKDTRPRLMMSPRGRPLTQGFVRELAKGEGAVIVCGRFEGVDERVIETRELQEVSVGDYILSGGEPAALVLLDAIVRLLPGVMGNDESGETESFETGLLEHPHYTKPAEFEGHKVPSVLTSGDHGKVDQWRREQALELTKTRRPDLLGVTQQDVETLKKLEADLWMASTRYDDAYIDEVFAEGFYEIGCSGKHYTRDQLFLGEKVGGEIDVQLPLPEFKTELISNEIVQTTYKSIENGEGARQCQRSSLWQRGGKHGWQLLFHQGTLVS